MLQIIVAIELFGSVAVVCSELCRKNIGRIVRLNTLLGEVVLKYLATIVFFLTSGVAMAEGLFLHSHSSVSDRFAILDETDQVAFLYLTQKGSQQPMRDAIAYMRVQPPKEVDWKAMAENGNPPILSEEFASDQAVITDVEESSFSFEWSADGNSAVLVFRGDPIALVAESEQIGFSKAVATPNKLTNPWDQDVYRKLFGR